MDKAPEILPTSCRITASCFDKLNVFKVVHGVAWLSKVRDVNCTVSLLTTTNGHNPLI
jgi:hypothetical protein